MTDDPTGADDATDVPAPVPDPAPAPGPEPADDDWLAQAPPPTVPRLDPAVAALAPLAAGTRPGWYRTTIGNDLRWWDGAAWTDRTTPGEAEKASYGQRFRRRFWVVLLVVAGVTLLLGASVLLRGLGEPNTRGAAYAAGTVLGAAFGMLLLSLLVTLLVALVPGGQQLDPITGRPRPSRLVVWAVLAVVVVAPFYAYSTFQSRPVAIATIASTKDGCNAYLDTVEKLATENVTDARVKASLQALHDAALEHDPQLAADLQPVIADPSGANSATATKAILTRCVDDGDLTATEIQTWAARIQAVIDKAGA